MDFSFISLEVDGSLRNPTVLLALTCWSVVLSTIAAILAIRLARSRAPMSRTAIAIALVCLLVFGYFLTRPFVVIVGTAIYRIGNPKSIGVGFWYGPPSWPAPLMAGVVFLTVLWRVGRKYRSEARPA